MCCLFMCLFDCLFIGWLFFSVCVFVCLFVCLFVSGRCFYTNEGMTMYSLSVVLAGHAVWVRHFDFFLCSGGVQVLW